jgi:hypothetical protein
MKIPKEKENPEQPIEPIIILRIIRLAAWFEPTRSNQEKGMEGSCDEEKCV